MGTCSMSSIRARMVMAGCGTSAALRVASGTSYLSGWLAGMPHRTDHKLPELPDEIIEQARYLIEQGESHQWLLGDYLAGVVDELSGYYSNLLGADQASKQVRHARAHIIRQIADRTGTDRSTLRDREVMARFYPPDLRDEYAPLTYHQLRACKSAGERWREYATWALDNLPAPPAIIRLRIKHNGDIPPAWIGRWDRIYNIACLILDDKEIESIPKHIRDTCLFVKIVYENTT